MTAVRMVDMRLRVLLSDSSGTRCELLGYGLVATLGVSGFGHHFDRMTRTLLVADRAAGAQVIVVAIEAPFPELYDRLLGTGCVTVVTFETVAAGQTAQSLEARFVLRQAGDHFLEADPFRRRRELLHLAVRVEEDGQVEPVEADDRVLRPLLVRLAAQPGVDIACGFLSMA